MNTSSFAFPIPVLGNGNDILSTYSSSASISSNPDFTVINIVHNVENEYISKLIADHLANFVTEVFCSGTFYRKTYTTFDKQQTIKIPTKRLREKIKIKLSVIATEDIPYYAPENLNPFFDDLQNNFSVTPGDLLAIGNTYEYIIDYNFDPLSAKVSSFIKVQPKNKEDVKIDVDLNNDSILILIPNKMYDTYTQIKNIAKDTVHASIVLPALIYTLETIKKDSDSYIGYAWFDRLIKILDAKHLDYINNDSLMIAQTLLGGPINRSLLALKQNAEDSYL